jgi:hypothetical protein
VADQFHGVARAEPAGGNYFGDEASFAIDVLGQTAVIAKEVATRAVLAGDLQGHAISQKEPVSCNDIRQVTQPAHKHVLSEVSGKKGNAKSRVHLLQGLLGNDGDVAAAVLLFPRAEVGVSRPGVAVALQAVLAYLGFRLGILWNAPLLAQGYRNDQPKLFNGTLFLDGLGWHLVLLLGSVVV